MDFSKHIQKAEEALKRRNYDFAIEVYRQLVDIDPDQGEARAGLRVAYRKKHEAKRGSKLLRAIGGAMPLVTAKSLRKAGKHASAAKQLESYLASNPMDEEGNLLLGMCLEDAGHFKSARAVYEYLAEIAPKNPEGLKRAGAMMHRTGDHPKALEYFERALEADPRDQEALKARKDLAAETALAAARYDQVQHSRDQIKDKDQARRLERAQRRHLSEDDLKEELTRLETRFADDPSNADLMVEMAGVHEKLRDFEAALDFIERAASYRKDSFELICKEGDLRARVLKKKLARAGKDGDQDAAGTVERELWEHEAKNFQRRVDLHPGDADPAGRAREAADEARPASTRRWRSSKRVRPTRASNGTRCSSWPSASRRRGSATWPGRNTNGRSKESATPTRGRRKSCTISGQSPRSKERRTRPVRSTPASTRWDIGYRDVAAKDGAIPVVTCPTRSKRRSASGSPTSGASTTRRSARRCGPRSRAF